MNKTQQPGRTMARLWKAITRSDLVRNNGRVHQAVGLLIESAGPAASIGDLCEIATGRAQPCVRAEVVGFRDNRALLMPLGDTGRIAHGQEVAATGKPLLARVGEALLGRVLDALGGPIDGGPALHCAGARAVSAQPPHPLRRGGIDTPLPLGVRVLDGLLTCGRGQRIGIFAGSGVGKSTLLGMIARYTAADVRVIALIGERGREVRDFIEHDLGPEALARSVVVVATSDQPAILRLKGALVATTIAEYFRDRGLHVLLMMDSITRWAWAQREIGLAVGEPPTTRGYTPSVFAALPRLLERSGAGEAGSITGIYTILVEGDDMSEPVADAARSTLDGHIVLSRALAARGHYPAVDVLESVSRLMPAVADDAHLRAATKARSLIAAYRSAEDLISIGAYQQGSNARVDEAVARIAGIEAFLRQDITDRAGWEATIAGLCEVTSARPAAKGNA